MKTHAGACHLGHHLCRRNVVGGNIPKPLAPRRVPENRQHLYRTASGMSGFFCFCRMSGHSTALLSIGNRGL